MAFDPISGVIMGGSALLNYFGGQRAQDKAIEAQERINAQNRADAYHMAENSVKMRVDDANRAGVHPAYALGAPTAPAPVSQVGAAGVPYNKMAPLAKGMADLGQEISRPAVAPVSATTKLATVQTAQQVASNNLDLETKQLNLQLLKARLANMTGTPVNGPASDFPVPEKNKPEERPPLMLFGNRWLTNPNTSPMKAWEDQYGDDGPASWVMPPIIGANDIGYNIKHRGGLDETNAINNLGSGWATVARWLSGSMAMDALQNIRSRSPLPVRPTYRIPERR